MIAHTGHAFLFVFAFLIFLAFLVLLAVLAKIAASASRGPKEGSRGCLGGCGLALVLLFLCALGAAGFVAFLVAAAGATAATHNPVRGITVLRDAAEPDHVRVVLEVEGDVRRLVQALERRFGRGAVHLRVTRRGGGRSEIELDLPIDRGDVEQLERELQDLGFDLPKGIQIQLGPL